MQHAWTIFALWLSVMAGLSVAAWPDPVALAGPEAAERAERAWITRVGPHLEPRPQLWIGTGAPCPCDESSLKQLKNWAAASAIAVQPVPGQMGVAITDARGKLRYAGDAMSIVGFCSGLSGFSMWWRGTAQADAYRPVVTLPCGCDA